MVQERPRPPRSYWQSHCASGKALTPGSPVVSVHARPGLPVRGGEPGTPPCLGASLCPWGPVQPITASIPSAGAGSRPCSPRGVRADHHPAWLGLWACGRAGDRHPCCAGSRLSPEADIASTLSESRGSWVVAEFAGGSYSWWEAAAAVACWTKLMAALAPSRGQVRHSV